MREATLVKRILLALSEAGATVFRQNTGQGWAGRTDKHPDGTVIITDARPLRAGLCTGSSDIIGWTTREITPDMVGQRVAVFTAVEAKTRRGRLTAEQRRFLDAVAEAGGVAGVARSVEDALALLEDSC